MAWIQLPSVSVSNGSKLVTVPGGYDLANVEAGWSLDVGTARAEIQSVSAQDVNGVTTITLARNWDGSNVVAQPAQIVPIAGGELHVIKQLQEANDYAVQTHAALRDYGTQDADITLTPPGGEPVQFASMAKQNRLATEQRNSNQQSFNSQLQQQQSDVNELLSNKTADGNDTTPGALLKVGATVKQLDTSNSNIRFEQKALPLFSCNLVKNDCSKFDLSQQSLVKASFDEIFNTTRSSEGTKKDFFGKITPTLADVSRIDYIDSVSQGVRVEGASVNIASKFSSGTWASSLVDSQFVASELIEGDTAVIMTPTVDNDYHFIYSAYYSVKPNTDYVASVWLDDDELFNVRFIFRSTGTVPGNSGVFGPIGSRFSEQIDRLGNKRRYQYKFSTASDCNDLQVRLYAYSDITGAYEGDGLKAIKLEGFQLEEGAIATTNIIPGISPVSRDSEFPFFELPAAVSSFTVLLDINYTVIGRLAYDYLLFLGPSPLAAGAGWVGVAFYSDSLRIRSEGLNNLDIVYFPDIERIDLKIGLSFESGKLYSVVNGVKYGPHDIEIGDLNFLKLLSSYQSASGSSLVRFIEYYQQSLTQDEMIQRLNTVVNI